MPDPKMVFVSDGAMAAMREDLKDGCPVAAAYVGRALDEILWRRHREGELEAELAQLTMEPVEAGMATQLRKASEK